jgi:hypothetical protein
MINNILNGLICKDHLFFCKGNVLSNGFGQVLFGNDCLLRRAVPFCLDHVHAISQNGIDFGTIIVAEDKETTRQI